MRNLFSVGDRVIVITGAAGVLGSAMVRHFAEQGAQVVVLDRNLEAGERLAAEVAAEGAVPRRMRRTFWTVRRLWKTMRRSWTVSVVSTCS